MTRADIYFAKGMAAAEIGAAFNRDWSFEYHADMMNFLAGVKAAVV